MLKEGGRLKYHMNRILSIQYAAQEKDRGWEDEAVVSLEYARWMDEARRPSHSDTTIGFVAAELPTCARVRV